jgi:hypothetical protein
VILRVADHIEQPDEASRPAAAFVVVHHINGLWIVAQLTKQRL